MLKEPCWQLLTEELHFACKLLLAQSNRGAQLKIRCST